MALDSPGAAGPENAELRTRLDEAEAALGAIRTGVALDSAQRENVELRARLDEAEATLQAIRRGEVDAITLDTPAGEQVFTLKGAELAYRVMVETMGEGAVTLTQDGTILFANQRFAEMVEAPLPRVIGSSFLARFSEDGAAEVRTAIRQSQTRARAVRVRASLLAFDATPIPVTIALHSQTIDGARSIVASVVTDLSDIVTAQEAQRTSEARYRTLVDTINDGLLQVDAENTITFVNPRFARMLGYGEAELLGHRSTDFMDEETATSIPARVERRKAGIAERYELNWRTREGQSLPTLVSARPLLDAEGRYRGSVSIITDLTELKRAEMTAQDSQQRLAVALRAGKAGTFDWDIKNNVNYWSPEIEKLYGVPPGTFAGTFEAWTDLVFPEDAAAAKAAVEFALKTGAFSGEWRVRRPDGSVIWLAATAVVLFDKGGRPERMIGVNVDVTERKHAEEEVRRLNAELERRVAERTAQLAAANRELEGFAYSVSHDLRTPLQCDRRLLAHPARRLQPTSSTRRVGACSTWCATVP